MYRPTAIILQCGADSLCYDKLGDFNLSIKGHGQCVEFCKSLNLPILLLGGGGYTVENVARCWTYETSICLDEELPNDLPITDFYCKYGQGLDHENYKLHLKPPSTVPNLNDKNFVEELIHYSIDKLKCINHVPNVDYNLPEEMYSEFNNELKSNFVNKRDHQSEFYDENLKKIT